MSGVEVLDHLVTGAGTSDGADDLSGRWTSQRERGDVTPLVLGGFKAKEAARHGQEGDATDT